MLGLGMQEILLIGIVLLLVVGPERLPHAVRGLGRAYGQLRRAADDMRRAFVLEADRLDAEERIAADRERRASQQDAAAEAKARIGAGVVPQLPEPPDLSTPAASTPESPWTAHNLSESEWTELPPQVRDVLVERTQASASPKEG